MTTELVPRESQTVDPVLMPPTFEGTMSVAKVFAESGFFHDAKQGAQALVKIMAGRELGFPPFAAMTGIFVAESRNGRPARLGFHANLMAAAVKRSGRYDYDVIEHDEQKCVLEFFALRGGKRVSLGKSPFTMDDARRAGLANGANYSAFPRNMTFARAMSNGVKWYCPDVFGGPVYTPEELDDEPTPPESRVPLRPEEVGERARALADPAPAAPGPALEEKPPSYEPMGAIHMITELCSGKFDSATLERYFGPGVRTKSALEKHKAEAFDAFKGAYERLRGDYKAGKVGVTTGAAA